MQLAWRAEAVAGRLYIRDRLAKELLDDRARIKAAGFDREMTEPVTIAAIEALLANPAGWKARARAGAGHRDRAKPGFRVDEDVAALTLTDPSERN